MPKTMLNFFEEVSIAAKSDNPTAERGTMHSVVKEKA